MKRYLLALALLLFASRASAVLVCTSVDDNFDDADAGQFDEIILTATWYVGQPAPSLDIGAEQFVTCAASGAELASIIVKFPNLPQRKNSAMTIWHGDNARFILDNL